MNSLKVEFTENMGSIEVHYSLAVKDAFIHCDEEFIHCGNKFIELLKTARN